MSSAIKDHVNILVRMPNWLGDSVMAMPALRHLHDSLPKARIFLAGRENFRGLFLAQPGVAGFVNAPASGIGNLIKGMTDTRSFIRDGGIPGGIDVGLLLTNSLSTAAWLWRLKAKTRIGYDRDARRLFLTHPLPCGGVEASMHFIHYYLWLAKYVESVIHESDVMTRREVEAMTGYVTPRIQVGDTARREAGKTLMDLGVKGKYAVLAPASAYGPVKDWPAAHYRELARWLTERGLSVVVTGAGGQAEMCGGICEGLDGVHNAAGKTSMDGFAGLLEGTEVFVGGDSGGAHVAGALGIPTVVIFGITNPGRTRPSGKCVVCVGEGEERDVKLSTPKARGRAQAALEAISPAHVREAVEEALRRRNVYPLEHLQT